MDTLGQPGAINIFGADNDASMVGTLLVEFDEIGSINRQQSTVLARWQKLKQSRRESADWLVQPPARSIHHGPVLVKGGSPDGEIPRRHRVGPRLCSLLSLDGGGNFGFMGAGIEPSIRQISSRQFGIIF